VAPNTTVGLNALLLDLDHDDWWHLREEAVAMGAPVPDLVVDPWSGRAHGVLWLASPVRTGEAAFQKPQATADYAGRLLAAAWRATLLPQVALVKSPWGRVSHLSGLRLFRGQRPSVPARWEAYEAARAAGSDLMWDTVPGTGPAELRDILRVLAPRYEFDAAHSKSRPGFRKSRSAPSDAGRNSELFDLVRWWAYDHAETSTEAIRVEAERINASGIFATPLPAAEVSGLARSIGRFMRTRYRPQREDDVRRGRDREAGADLPPKARQALAGQRTAAADAEATDARIATALATLQLSGAAVTQAAVAAEAGVSDRTVRRRWHVAQNRTDAALSGDAAPGAPLASLSPEPPFASLAALAARDRTRRRDEAASAKRAAAEFEARRREDARAAVERAAACAALHAHAVASARPGARPSPLPTFPAAVAADPDVRQARRAAEAATDDARRRAEDRVARQAAAERSADMRRRAVDLASGWRWFQDHITALEADWNAREAGADSRDRPGVRLRREAVLIGRWRSWRAAVRHHRPDPPDSEIPW